MARREKAPLCVRLWQRAQSTKHCGCSSLIEGAARRSTCHLCCPNPSLSSFEDVIEAGLRLQALLARGNVGAAMNCASQLESFLNNGRSNLKPLAAYHLWPWYAWWYYRWPIQGPRLIAPIDARGKLCAIQDILYQDPWAVLVVLRRSFEAYDDEELRPYLAGENRRDWRAGQLIDHSPDLCAVDWLAIHVLDLLQAQDDIDKATDILHHGSLKHDPITTAARELIMKAFQKLHVAQITAFLPVRTTLAPGAIPALHEVSRIPGLEQALPFHVLTAHGQWEPDPYEKHFRNLADLIYSCDDTATFRCFTDQKLLSLAASGQPAVRFISDAETTLSFITNAAQLTPWPCVYARLLEDLEGLQHIPDWVDSFWWCSIHDNALRDQLLGNLPAGCLHGSPHWSALWDYLASRGEVTEPAPDPVWLVAKERSLPAGKLFGYLLELLLRIRRTNNQAYPEAFTRTSLFCAFTQTFGTAAGELQDQLTAFLGGTFQALERPGIPYSAARFEAVEKRMCGLLMALANYLHSRELLLESRARYETASQLRQRCGGLLAGFDSNGPPFSDPHHEVALSNPYVQPHIKNSPFRLWSAHILQHAKDGQMGILDGTLKALFALAGGDEGWDAILETPRDVAYKPISCPDCLATLLTDLTGGEVRVSLESDLMLPSHPGMRFLILLAYFLGRVMENKKKAGRQATLNSLRYVSSSRKHTLVVAFDNGGELVASLQDRYAANQDSGVLVPTLRNIQRNSTLDNWLLEKVNNRRALQVLKDPGRAKIIGPAFYSSDGELDLTWDK